jgi:Ras-related protein Rab-18
MHPRTHTQHHGSLNIKLLVLGIASVGKSSLLLRFTDQQWLPEEEMNPTIGVDTWVMSRSRGGLSNAHTFLQEHKLEVKGKRVNLNIWVRRFLAARLCGTMCSPRAAMPGHRR